MRDKNRIFLDYASATPVRVEVLEAMSLYEHGEIAGHFANPSALYAEAREAKALMLAARAEVGEFLNCAKEQIVFTGGGTEANNMAILGVFEYARQQGWGNGAIKKPHIISVLTEHPSVREVLDEVVRRGGEVTLLQPDSGGLISAEQVRAVLTPSTILISVMMVNNEIGVIQPIREIAKTIKEYRKKNLGTAYPYLHTDACQAALFQTLDVSTLGVDLLTLDGLKIGGPRGGGVLYVHHGNGIGLSPIVFGGGQEGGLRSGTEDVARMIGMATALRLAKAERAELADRLEKMCDYFTDKILETFSGDGGIVVHVNGSRKHRVANNVNVCFSASFSAGFSGLDAEYLVVALDTYGVACSYSSSCRTLKEDSSSYVVEALGTAGHKCAHSSLRFTLGRETTQDDLDRALEALQKAVAQVSR